MLIPNLSVLLAERRLTLSKVSQDTGISRTTLTALTSRTAKGIQFDTLNTLCQYLKVTPDQLFIYRPFDLTLSAEGLPGRAPVYFTVTRAGGAADRYALIADAQYRYAPTDPATLERLTLRLSLPDEEDKGTVLLSCDNDNASIPAPTTPVAPTQDKRTVPLSPSPTVPLSQSPLSPAADLIPLLRALPPSVLADIERDLLALYDAHIPPTLAPRDYIPDLIWP